MGKWDDLMNATAQATGKKVDESVKKGERPLNEEERAFRIFETRITKIGTELNNLFDEIKAYKKQKGIR